MAIAAFIAFIAALFSAALAFTVAWRGGRTIHRSFAAGMFVLAVESLFNGLAFVADVPEEQVFWQQCRLIAMAFLPGIWLFFSLSYGRGNYRDFIRRWRFILAAAFLIPIGLAILFQGQLISGINIANGRKLFVLMGVGVTLNLLFLAGAVLVLMNLERTFRSAIGTMRWRIKFMIVGLGVLFAVRCYCASQAILFHAVDLSLQTLSGVALFAACALISRSLFRTGHFDVDIYPSHSLLQNSLTALLGGIYLLVIGIFANVVAYLGGDNAFAAKAFFILIALVLLAVLLLSDRVRLWSARFVSRHFQRPQYDYRDLWRKFTESTASCAGPNDLAQATVKFTANIFHVLSVTIWLVDENGEQLTFAASTSLSAPQTGDIGIDKDESRELLAALKQKSGPFDIDLSREKLAATLKKMHPTEFTGGGRRVCAPLAVGGVWLGFIILGDRIGGVSFSGQDLDLLKCIADEIAASLLNSQLSRKLLQAKELEAFQTMSAFFVHDLKNAASSLKLMVKNLPVHFDDPAFREDALRGMSKSVAHINRLIERLTLLRNELKIMPTEGDLNDWLSKSLADFEKNSGAHLVKDLRPLPKLSFDHDQLLKVLTNLALNAKEASPADEPIHVATTQVNGWAVLSVSDHGCGMNREFLNRSLFRPFQTTKKNGIGIGMFQSKIIIEAHRGRIEVQSETGKGTTFRVFLPFHQDHESNIAHS
ncbi:MAG TPA: XrtA/PEP-CTERM system histidine kinase PrsK [Candidatus Acidoferrales bacterium]|jgi:putative PEP-CTERM system histidine kinase|nr:XrtA/PEP-CTERM system histidine kinase PrsK [Candidatus Acidoferrales bacterium]